VYAAVLMTHSLVRWLVLVAVTARTVKGMVGLAQGSAFGDLDRRLSLLSVIVTDLQVLFGIVLYAVSPNVRQAFADPGAAMGNGALRLVFVEHPLMAVVAVVLVHVSHAVGKRSGDDRKRHIVATVCGVLALAAILARLPG
jgi:hypothetical protein